LVPIIAAACGDACAAEIALGSLHGAWINAAFFSRFADAFASLQSRPDSLLNIGGSGRPAKALALSARSHKPGADSFLDDRTLEVRKHRQHANIALPLGSCRRRTAGGCVAA
jgi:hypothetical protein